MKKISYFAVFGYVKQKRPLGETGYLSIYFFYFFIFYFLFFLFECLGIQLYSSPTCDLRDTMPCQGSLLTLLPMEVEDFPRCGNHSKHMPPLTYLAWLQPIYYNSRFVFIRINITKVFTCGENFNKKICFQVQFLKIFFSGSVFKLISEQPWKYKAAATLISNHKLQNNFKK